MNDKAIKVSNLYYAVIEGKDERGNPVYGKPAKLVSKIKEHEEEI